ncbi:NAD(P)/FAD-dependent oxidoreductase [Robiginitalea sp. IMCC44478]|uniref:NAD(P)/FAD-dependent oxidoreductase n=1 Tax=Robiginitalea sp. IMCC44478 TaxID=3459122 RepID=UPI0040427112
MSKKIVVIGGGIMGLSSAYYLQKEGFEVTVLDKGEITAGASFVNAGYLTPSHIIPLAAPGMMAKAVKWMFDSSSPFYMKPRLDSNFLRWAWSFNRSARPSRVQQAIPVIAEINTLSKALYQQLLESSDLGEFQLEKSGLLMLYKSAQLGEAEKKVMQRVLDLGLEARALSREELLSLQPGLKEDIQGAVHYACDAHTTPGQIMQRMLAYLQKKGIAIHTGTLVEGFEAENGRIARIKSNQGIFEADEVVLAAGAWSPLLSQKLGLNLLLEAGKGYRIDISRNTPVKIPAILMDSKVAITPMDGFTRLAGTMEFSGINHKIRKNRVKAIASAVESYYEGLSVQEEELEQAACGLRPVSPDGLPYIGRVSNWKNLCLATGHAMMGWSLGPITGKLITELISGKPTSMDIKPFEPERRF